MNPAYKPPAWRREHAAGTENTGSACGTAIAGKYASPAATCRSSAKLCKKSLYHLLCFMVLSIGNQHSMPEKAVILYQNFSFKY